MDKQENKIPSAPPARELPSEQTGDRMIYIYAQATRLAISRNQVTGEKHEYFVTLNQLQFIIERMQGSGTLAPQTGYRQGVTLRNQIIKAHDLSLAALAQAGQHVQ